MVDCFCSLNMLFYDYRQNHYGDDLQSPSYLLASLLPENQTKLLSKNIIYCISASLFQSLVIGWLINMKYFASHPHNDFDDNHKKAYLMNKSNPP